MIYTKEFLISELHRFVEENGRNPKQKDMGINYPSFGTYFNYFGTWNNALIEAGLKLNQYHNYWQDGTETCDICGKLKQHQWYYKNEQRLCPSCYMNRDYKNGNLDSESKTGFAFISQRVVAKTLGLELKYDCNCSIGFKSEYDLYDKKLGYINVKARTLLYRNAWYFDLKNKSIPDTYILLGFSADKSDILYVWITEPEDDLTFDEKKFKYKQTISITNSYKSLKRAEPWEVDVKPYNDAYHNMSLDNCRVLRND